jgi:NAD(P)-dependent dehydrogenase (short-subunit alcohol dehydrogenase family)
VKTVCVTGAASGIGAATKQRLERDGTRVIGVDLRDAEIVADLSAQEGRRAAVDGVLAAADGVLHGVVPCAGVGGTGSAELTVRLNYFSVRDLLDGLRPALVAAGEAAVVLISSFATTTTSAVQDADIDAYLEGDEDSAVKHFADSGYLAYPAGKLALAYWMRRSAPVWIADGIRINAVAPGVIETNMTKPLKDLPGTADALSRIPIPLGRWGRPEEVAAAIAFLLGAESSYVLGQTLFVDGGTDAQVNPRGHPAPNR